MIGIDTNVLVRFLVQDDPIQSAAATQSFRAFSVANPGHLSVVALVETYWVLSRAYRISPDSILTTIEGLLEAEELVCQDAAIVATAVTSARSGTDFADALIAAASRHHGCDFVLSFDTKAQASLGFRSPAAGH